MKNVVKNIVLAMKDAHMGTVILMCACKTRILITADLWRVLLRDDGRRLYRTAPTRAVIIIPLRGNDILGVVKRIIVVGGYCV